MITSLRNLYMEEAANTDNYVLYIYCCEVRPKNSN